MSLEDNKAIVRRFIDEVMNTGNADAISNFCVPGSRFADGIAGQIKNLRTTFPDYHFTIDEIVAEGDKVTIQTTQRGTNNGPLIGLPAFGRLEMPVPPTGQSVMVTGISIYKVVDGKIVNFTSELDQVGLLRQMGWTFTPPSHT